MDWKEDMLNKLTKLQLSYYDHGFNSDTIAPNIDAKPILDDIESLLKQQREICAEQMVDRDIIDRNSFAYKGILNAPEPTGEIK